MYLWNCTEVEDTLIFYPRHVLEDIGHMLESVSYEKVETVNSFGAILFQFEVGQLLTKLTPRLETGERVRPVNKVKHA